MIRQGIFWFILSWKRITKYPLFLLLFLLLPLGAFFFRQAEQEDTGKIPIALSVEESEWNLSVAEVLLQEDSGFDFYLCESVEELKEDVAAGRAECGFSLPADLKERLDSGDYKRAIRVICSPAAVVDGIASETVFAGLFQVYGRDLLEEYVKYGEAFEPARLQLEQTELEECAEELLWQQVELLYEKALSDGSTFAFAYETMDGDVLKEETIKAVFPVKGVGAVLLFIMGLAAAVLTAEDEQRGFYRGMTRKKRHAFQLISIFAVVLLFSVSVLSSVFISGEARTAGQEIMNMVLYCGMITIFSFVLFSFFPNPLLLSSLIPFFLLGCLVVCPVFADLSPFVPALSVIRKFFLPWYYLTM